MSTTRGFKNAVAIIAAGCLLALAACGGGGGDGDTGNGDTATQDTAMPDTGTPEDTSTPEDTNTPDPDTGSDDTGSPADTGQMDTGSPDDTGSPGDTSGGPDAGQCTFFPDSCPSSQNCYRTAQGRQCAAFNSEKTAGDSCNAQMPNDCADGLICAQGTCRAKCDPDDTQQYGCEGDNSCVQLADQQGNPLPFGICQPPCTVWPDDNCGQGENCYPTQSGGTSCGAFNPNNTKGDSCNGLNDCADNLVCYQTDPSQDGTCVNKCNADNPCESGSCQMPSNLPFGVCPPSQ